MTKKDCEYFVATVLSIKRGGVELKEKDVSRIEDFLTYLRHVRNCFSSKDLKILELKYGVKGNYSIDIKDVSFENENETETISRLRGASISFDLIRKRYKDFFEVLYGGGVNSDPGFYFRNENTPADNVPIVRLTLSNRICNALSKAGVKTVGDLSSIKGGFESLRKMRGISNGSVLQIRRVMLTGLIIFKDGSEPDFENVSTIKKFLEEEQSRKSERRTGKEKKRRKTIEHLSQVLLSAIAERCQHYGESIIPIETLIPDDYEIPEGIIDWEDRLSAWEMKEILPSIIRKMNKDGCWWIKYRQFMDEGTFIKGSLIIRRT